MGSSSFCLTRIPAASDHPIAGCECPAPSLCMNGVRWQVIPGNVGTLLSHKLDVEAFVGEAVTNLDGVIKSRDISLPTKV